MDGIPIGTCGWLVDEMIMLYIIDDIYLMHDWYVSITLVEEPSTRLIGTCFMEDLAYIYGIHHFVVLLHDGVHVLVHSHMEYS
jgi:hypothetical protein